MKTVATLAVVLLCGSAVRAQGTVQFSCAITGLVSNGTSTLPVQGYGSLGLNLVDAVLTYDVRVPNLRTFPAEAHFHVTGSDTIISLGPFVYLNPQVGNGWPGGIVYDGTLPLQPGQVTELLAGEWYINLHSPNYVGGVLRGYIVPVPEPGPVPLLALCAGLGLALRRIGLRKVGLRQSRVMRRKNHLTGEAGTINLSASVDGTDLIQSGRGTGPLTPRQPVEARLQ